MLVGETVNDGAGTLDRERLRAALDEANIPTLLMVLVHLTGDTDRWLTDRYRPVRPRGLDDNDSGGLKPEAREEIIEAVFAAIVAHREHGVAPKELPSAEVARMLGVALAEDVPSEYGPLLCEELGLEDRDVEIATGSLPDGFNVLIIGGGISGLCAAVKLEAAGIDYTLIEKNETIGGTWFENTYPGCGVDTPSHLYSFSFAPSSEWSGYFAKRDEVWRYLEAVADEHEIRGSVLFGAEVERADFDSASGRWEVRVRDRDGGERTLNASVIISAVGQVNRPLIPALPGLEDFDGPVMHTAQWRQDVELEGRTVAVIGNGASAMQLVPSIADEAGRVVVFQRSKQWALPHPNYKRNVADGVRYLMAEVPLYARWYRLRAFWNFGDRLHPSLQIDPEWPHPDRAINAVNDSHRRFLTRYIRSELGDRDDLVDACLPDYPPYGKRPLIDNGWYRTLCRDDVTLVSERVESVGPKSVVTSSGTEIEVDVVALATGFQILQFLAPMEIRGRSGRTLRDTWGPDDARAYLGVSVPDFPNLFILNGPNTFAGHGGSAVLSIEFQTRHVMEVLAEMARTHSRVAEVEQQAYDSYNEELDAALQRTIWSHRGMTTYFRNEAGRVVVSSPWTYLDYWDRTHGLDPTTYRFDPSGEC